MRDARMDAAKGMAIVLVVLGHAKGIPATFTLLAYSFHVPLFFFLSGWVHETHAGPRAFDASVRRLVRGLLVPYACFFLLGYAYWLLTRNIGEKAARWADHPWWQPLQGLFTGIGPSQYVHPAIWFLMAMFVTLVAFLALRRLARPAWIAIASLLGAWAWIGWFPAQGIRLPFAIDVLPISLFFFAAGAFSSSTLRQPTPMAANLVLFALLAATWSWIALGNGRVDINQMRFGATRWAFFAASLAGIGMTLCLAQSVRDSALLQWLGRNTLLILCTHILVLFVLSGIASLAGGFPHGKPGPAWALFASAVAIAASVPLRWMFRSYAPWAIGMQDASRARETAGRGGEAA